MSFEFFCCVLFNEVDQTNIGSATALRNTTALCMYKGCTFEFDLYHIGAGGLWNLLLY